MSTLTIQLLVLLITLHKLNTIEAELDESVSWCLPLALDSGGVIMTLLLFGTSIIANHDNSKFCLRCAISHL